jgi:hypothetical protein
MTDFTSSAPVSARRGDRSHPTPFSRHRYTTGLASMKVVKIDVASDRSPGAARIKDLLFQPRRVQYSRNLPTDCRSSGGLWIVVSK